MINDQAFQQAITCHQAGQLQDAERIYRSILQAQPNHPDANHNLGVLAVQMKRPGISLPYFMAALEADPTQERYWLSYIDALIQTGQIEAARQVLAHARQHGLQSDQTLNISMPSRNRYQILRKPHKPARKKQVQTH